MINESFYRDFPSLVAIEQELAATIDKIDAEIEDVKHSPRFDTNDAERQYQLKNLQDEREQVLAEQEEKFQRELTKVEEKLAKQAFSAPITFGDDEEKSKKVAQEIVDQLIFHGGNEHIIDNLLKTRVKTLSDGQKHALKVALIAANLNVNDDVMKELNATKYNLHVQTQLDALNRIKAGGGSIRRVYDARSKAISRAFGGNN